MADFNGDSVLGAAPTASDMGGAPSSAEPSIDALLEGVLKSESIDNTALPKGSEIAKSGTNAQGKTAAEQEFEIQWKGRNEKLPLSKMKTLAQKGFDYEQNISLLKRERENFEKERSSLGDWNRLQEIKKIDDFGRANPNFIKTVQYYYDLAQKGQLPQVPGSETGQASADPLNSNPADAQQSLLARDLETLKHEVHSLHQAKMNQAVESATKQLDADMGELKESFKDLNWDKTDDFGYTREHQILKHIQQTGQTAKQAFWQLFGEQAAELKAQRAVQTKLEEIQKNHKRGVFIGNTLSKSNAVGSAPKDVQSKSYDDISKQVLRDFNIAL